MRMLSLYHVRFYMIDLEMPIATVVRDRDRIDLVQITAINYKSVQTLKV